MLKVEKLQLRLNGKAIIDDLNLHVKPGEIHGLLGENGTGKTSVAYLIMGVNNYRPTAGRIIFEGQDIAPLSISQRAKQGISLAWQEPARIEGLTVRDYLKLSGENANVESVKQYLLMVGLDPAQYLDRDVDNTLSGGERKRIDKEINQLPDENFHLFVRKVLDMKSHDGSLKGEGIRYG